MIALEEYNKLVRQDKKDLGNCGTCRACWDHDIVNVSYPIH